MATARNIPLKIMECNGKPSVDLAPFGRMELCAPDDSHKEWR
ncbi:MAG: hypothetical protein QXL84_06105 [Thermoplasmata archaeon]